MNILTGLQATGNLHIGNYFGAILPMAQKSKSLSEEDSMFFFVPDLHSLTGEINYKNFQNNILEIVACSLASGIDYSKSNLHFYRQSFVPAHSEMQWLLSCFSYFGEMGRMTQFKDKSSERDSNINVGLFAYPILMAGDILLYDADYIPIGEDQQQHLELCRNLAIRINNKFEKEIFVVPKARNDQMKFFNMDKALRIRSLSNPEKKMSKSSPDEKSKILLNDDPKIAVKKIMSATTDSLGQIKWDWDNQPGITNLMQILSILSNKPVEEVRKEWEGQTMYGGLKKAVAEQVEIFLTDFQAKFSQIDNSVVQEVLQRGELNANKVANQTLFRFQQNLGLRK